MAPETVKRQSASSSRRWINAIENTQAPVVILDKELNILWRNSAFRNFRETPGLEYKGRPLFALFHGLSDETERQHITSQLGSPDGGGWQGMVEGRGPKHRLFRASLSIVPLRFGADGVPYLFMATFSDLTETFRRMTHSNFDCILQASLLKDQGTGDHVKRVNSYSRLLAQTIKGDSRWFDIDDDFIEDIGLLAAYHDVGKIGTPDSLLMKKGSLTQEEWSVMKQHPVMGAQILALHPNSMVSDIALFHHERWDGGGYPEGREGEDIPVSARIVAVADTYDALRSKRPYKQGFSEQRTFSIIVQHSAVQFDPGLVDCLRHLRSAFDEIYRNSTP